MGADSDETRELERALEEGSRAIGALAANTRLFGPALKAFRAADAKAFDAALSRAQVLEWCELVCGWFCSKECLLVCLEFCGPPPQEVPNLREFADVVAKVTTDESVLERLVTSVERRDAKSFQALVKELELQGFCHLL